MIYIDLGCYNGDTVEQFISWGQLLGDISDAEIYAFDPQAFIKEWTDIKERQVKHVKDIHFIQSAAWVEDADIELSLWHEQPIGSTVMKAKRSWYAGEITTTRAFDFSKWLKQFDEDEEIYIKFDIEGAEYPVLRKMLADGTAQRCKLLMIEWHSDKLTEEYKEDEEIIKNALIESGTRWLEWR